MHWSLTEEEEKGWWAPTLLTTLTLYSLISWWDLLYIEKFRMQCLAGCHIFKAYAHSTLRTSQWIAWCFILQYNGWGAFYLVDAHVILNINLMKMRRVSLNTGGLTWTCFTKLMTGLIEYNYNTLDKVTDTSRRPNLNLKKCRSWACCVQTDKKLVAAAKHKWSSAFLKDDIWTAWF